MYEALKETDKSKRNFQVFQVPAAGGSPAEQREAVLRLLDRRRGQTGDPNLGSGMEKKILDLELADLETTMGIQESTERTVIRNIRPPRTDT